MTPNICQYTSCTPGQAEWKYGDRKVFTRKYS